ncbi:Uncharacterised protein [Collinsella intestinalis]|nr:Uncharacterised protein [Collinsella intestinalis]
MQVLRVGQHGVRVGAEEIDVPDVHEAHERDDVLLERRVLEVLIDGAEARQELLEALGPQSDDERQTDGRINGITTADPIPEAESVLRVDAEISHEVQGGGNGHEMLGNSLGILLGAAVDGAASAELLEHPRLDLTGVGERLERGERLGDDDDERGLGIEALHLLGHVVRIDVGDVTAIDAGVEIGLHGLVDHNGAEVGTTDADGDHMLDLLTADALPLTGADAIGKGVHAIEDLVNIGNDILAVDDELALLAGGTAEGGVQDGTVLRSVDMLAGEHGVTALLDAASATQVYEQLERLIGDEVLGQVEVQVTGTIAELLNAIGIGGEPILQADALLHELVVVLLKSHPRRGLGCIDGSGNRHVRPP